MTRIETLVCTSLLCLALVGCGSAPSEGVDASVPPDGATDRVDAGDSPDGATNPVDASAPVDAFNGSVLGARACASIVERATECLPEYASTCMQDELRAGCERVIVDWSPIRPIGLHVASGPCSEGIFNSGTADELADRVSPAASLDGVLEVLCNACPGAAAGYADEASTPADCRDYLGAAVDGTGTAITQRILRHRYLLLAEDQLVAIRDCVAANPTCDAFLPEECGQRFRDLDMTLAPDLVAPACE